jgi:hypothetical protein
MVSCDMFKLRTRENPAHSPGWTLPDSAQIVIGNLEHSFEDLNIVNYSNNFDDDFLFFADSVTYSRNPDVFNNWTRDVEIQTATVMFSQIRSNPEVDINITNADTSGDTVRLYCNYHINLNLQNGEALEVAGKSLFETILRDDGLYYLLKWSDFLPDTAIPGSITWSELKGRFKQ